VKHGAIFDPIRGDGWIRLCFARSKDIGEALPSPPSASRNKKSGNAKDAKETQRSRSQKIRRPGESRDPLFRARVG